MSSAICYLVTNNKCVTYRNKVGKTYLVAFVNFRQKLDDIKYKT